MAGPAGYTQPGGGSFSPTSSTNTFSGASSSSEGEGLLSSLLQMGLANRGRKNMADIYAANRDYNKQIMDEAYERSLPKGVSGPAGKVVFDKETEEMLLELDPEVQAVMDGWLSASRRAGDELAAYDMDSRTIEQISLFDKANEFRDRQDRQRLAEENFARGIAGTGAMYANMALGEQVNQRRLQEALQARGMAMNERQLLSAESIGMGNAAIDAPRTLMSQADLARAIGQGSATGVNAEGTSLASMALADTQAGFWSGLMGGASNYTGSSSGSSGGGGLLSGLMKGFSIFS